MEETHKAPSATGRRIARGTNLVVYTVIGLAIIVLINWFGTQHVKRWDLTKEQNFSLSPQTVKLVKGLTQDVTIYVFDQNQHFQQEGDVLNLYSEASHRVNVRYVDPNRDPGLAHQFGVRSYGTIVVAAGEKHFEAQSTDEQGVTNALIRVLKGQSVIYFIQGHGEHDPSGTESDGYSDVKKALESENDKVDTLTLLQTMAIPPDATAVVIAGPQHDYLPQEVDVLQKYLSGGGRVMLFLDPGVELQNLAKLTSDYNFTVQNDLVIDQNPVAQLFGTSPAMPLIVKYGSNPIAQPLSGRATLFPLTRSFELGKETKPGVTADSLCETSGESFDVTDFNPKMQKVEFRPGKDLKGPLTVAVAGTVPGEGEKKTEGRYVAVGTSLVAANNFLNFQSNRDFIMNSINWLSTDEDLISIRAKPPDSQHLTMNAQQMNRVLVLGVFGIPLLIILSGALVWWQRR